MTVKQRTGDAVSGEISPPRYNISDAVSAYVATRPPPAKMATNGIATHQLRLGDQGIAADAALYFPQPENVWLSRDVDHEDWETFITQLNMAADAADTAGAAQAEEHVAHRQDAIRCISQWNRTFFAPRSLRVLPLFGDQELAQATEAYEAQAQAQAQGEAVTAADAAPTEGGDVASRDPRRGYGIKLGKNSMLGLALPPHSNGFGIHLGGMLLGVQVGDDKDKDKGEEQTI